MRRTDENSIYLRILNSILTTPHRKLEELKGVHEEAFKDGQRFYGPFADWYMENGDVRDHKEIFTAMMLTVPVVRYREAGWVYFLKLPDYEKARAARFARDHLKKVTRQLKGVIEYHLRSLEDNPRKFDWAVLNARDVIKDLYFIGHVVPSLRAKKILLENDTPSGSILESARQIRNETDPKKQAALIVKYHIPYRIAPSLVKAMTPTVLGALIIVMSPQEVINNLASLKRRGALDNEDLKELINIKLEEAKSNVRVAAMKTRVAKGAADVPKEIAQKLDEVAQAQIERHGTIARSTALFIDKSGSMSEAIEVGKRIAALISGITKASLEVIAFDTMAYPITPEGTELSYWEEAFEGITAANGTSCGVPLQYLQKKKKVVEQIVLVTDEGENKLPFFVDEYETYGKEVGVRPEVVIVRVGEEARVLSQRLSTAEIAYSLFEFKGDYYALPNLIPLLTGPSQQELLQEILERELPRKPKSAVK